MGIQFTNRHVQSAGCVCFVDTHGGTHEGVVVGMPRDISNTGSVSLQLLNNLTSQQVIN